MGVTTKVRLPDLHPGQVRALDAYWPSAYQVGQDLGFKSVKGRKRKAVRCGRRWGKTDLIKSWIGDGALKGEPCGIFAPDYKRMLEIYAELERLLDPITPSRGGANKTDGVIRLSTGGRVDFWTLEDDNAGRSRYYKRVAIDEAGYTKPNMMGIWEKAIEPTLTDLRGDCLVASNTNGIDPANFLWAICHQSKYGFVEVHEPSWNNPWVPRPLPGDTAEATQLDRAAYYAEKKAKTHPLVFAQEYESAFVDWSGVAFFSWDKALNNGAAVPMPTSCDYVFAVIDSATKTGTSNDGTAVTYFARIFAGNYPLIILDWDIIQIEGSLLEAWLPTVLQNLEAFALACKAQRGSVGAFVEDKASGEILNQQARRRDLPVHPIESRLTALGKDERAISVSGYWYRGEVKITREANEKVTTYKGTSANHLRTQTTGFRIGDKDAAKRADDLLDTLTYGIAIALGDGGGF